MEDEHLDTTRGSEPEDTQCARCGSPLDLFLDGRLCYLCKACYSLLLDTTLVEGGQFWLISRSRIKDLFDELVRTSFASVIAAVSAQEAERYYAQGGTRKQRPPLGPRTLEHP